MYFQLIFTIALALGDNRKSCKSGSYVESEAMIHLKKNSFLYLIYFRCSTNESIMNNKHIGLIKLVEFLSFPFLSVESAT